MSKGKKKKLNTVAKNGVVVGESKSRTTPGLLKIAVVFIILVVAGLVIWLIVNWLSGHTLRKAEPAAYKTTSQAINHDSKSAADKSYADIISKGQNFLNKYSAYATKQQHYFIDNNIAIAYNNLDNYVSALYWAQQALTNNSQPTYSDYYLLATLYEATNDKKDAIKYYQLTLNKLSGNPLENFRLDNLGGYIQQKIKELKGSS